MASVSSKKIITVIGATGNQGGSVVGTFLQEPGWHIRGITRNTSSPKALALAARGVEVVQADMDEPPTLEPAFRDAAVIFAVSDFWGIYGEPTNKFKPKPGSLNVQAAEREARQLMSVIDEAAKVPQLERFILSSLSNPIKWSHGKYTQIVHFNSKVKAEDHARSKYPDLWKKTSLFQAGYFLSNFVINPITQPIRNEAGVLQFISNLDPNLKLPFIAPEEDSGPIVKALVQESAGKNIIGYREWLTLREITQLFTEATGESAEPVMLPRGESNLPYPPDLKVQLDECWAYWNEFGYEARDDPTVIHPQDLDSPPRLDSVINYFTKQDWSKTFT
ncbi:NmrA-like family domain-containing oxidoreductase hkm9-like protein [Cladobotryum mycophilum]|uniref:NmrA-like family domain-containing oxidoreductase hkm9-like protein n=1 Tax=Cladobotryum mycophilum TaxID=491253 RepID=A0ABR0SSY4_9HYPO